MGIFLFLLTCCSGIFHILFIMENSFFHRNGNGESKAIGWIKSGNKPVVVENRIQKGDTIITALKRENVDYPSAHRLVSDVKSVYDLKKVRTGKKYTLFLNREKGELKRFRYEIDIDRYLEVTKGEGDIGYKGKIVTVPFHMQREFISGEIHVSLFASILECGEKPELADIMASLYDYDIDFNRDIQKGDSYSLLVEKMFLKGRFVRYGNILAAEFVNKGKTIQVVRYTDPEGVTAYYHPDGRSVKKMFLRCPLPFMRLTSSYGNRRHPLFGFSRQHNGIDLAAPPGTAVRATASGIVFQAGYNDSKGRFVSIRHKNNFVTEYYHLSGIVSGAKSGARVEQGQLIGYVGNSGWSTGYHLHYGVRKNGVFINPLLLKPPTIEPVKTVYMKNFKGYTSDIFAFVSSSKLFKMPQPMSEAMLSASVKPLLQPISPLIGR